jgi:RHS repeat-associated protein
MFQESNWLAADSIKDQTPSQVSYFSYAANGDRELEFQAPPGNPWVTLRRLYYDGLGRTVGLRDVGITDGNGPGRYRCNLYGPSPYVLAPCSGGMEVPVWLVYDGPNVGATMQTNRWVFIHGGGIDDPLMAFYRGSGTPTEYYWITDGAGRHLAAGTSNGALTSNSQQGEHYLYRGGKWVGSTSAATSYDADRQSTITAPGYTFFRNRVYDQRTARWTQEDPIGLAGGLNLFQFNGSNPVTLTDPFGLCPEEKRDSNGNCPGGLTVSEWTRVEGGIAEVRHEGMRRRLTRMLNDGKIHAAPSLDDPDAYFGTNWHSGHITGTRRQGAAGISAFDLAPEDLGFSLVHEVGHVDQVGGLSTVQINQMQARRREDLAYRQFIERGAHIGACMFVPHTQIFAPYCE